VGGYLEGLERREGGERGGREGRGDGSGKREEGRGKREEGRGKREEGRGKREEERQRTVLRALETSETDSGVYLPFLEASATFITFVAKTLKINKKISKF
jgi:hypothetical protein